ncbi:hypothetical protein CSUB01_09422 [Colletotrichum sublineola]|uniref:Uncharacterized protein n=1 Tax=Colletotrichum sublineola TaxID=1173701 RepID=A0A066XME2_COLSU|nr:hypothetical protein CSUB01_09422 [Colletotrichum sublineola]
MERHPVKYHRSRAQHRRHDHLGHRHNPPDGTETVARHFYSNPGRGDRNSDVALVSDAGNSVDLVENWLSKTSRRGQALPEPMNGYHQGQDYLNDSTWRPHGLPLEDAPRRSHKRTRSHDSSIIVNPAKVPALLPPTTRRHQKKKLTNSNGTIDPSATPSPKFEKRPRHKTKEDRYETQERVRQRRKDQEEQRAPPHNNLPRKMSSHGREVMDNFRSGVILNDRLTPSIRWLLLNILGYTSTPGSSKDAPSPSKANGEKGKWKRWRPSLAAKRRQRDSMKEGGNGDTMKTQKIGKQVSTPSAVREALRRSGVFCGTGLQGKDPNFKDNSHRTDNSCNHNRTFQGWKEHVSLEKPTTIIRYTDKGVVTNNELDLPAGELKAPQTSKSPKSSKIIVAEELPTQSMMNNALSKNAQPDCSAEVDCETDTRPARADAATQACFVLQTEDIRTLASSKFFQRTPTETPTINVSTYSKANKMDMQSTTAVRPHIEITSTSELAKGTAAQFQKKDVRKPESAVFDLSWRSPSASESRHIDHLLAQDSTPFYQPNFLENRPPTRFSNILLSSETGCEKEVISKPWTCPQTTLQGSQQKGLPRALTAQSHRSAPMLNVSQFQSSERMGDFIARIEQDALRDEKHIMAYRPRIGDLSMAAGQHTGGNAQTRQDSGFDQVLEEPGWIYQRGADTNANGPKAGPFLETEFFVHPQSYRRASPQQSINQTEAYEQEEMKSFWRPNYFYY